MANLSARTSFGSTSGPLVLINDGYWVISCRIKIKTKPATKLVTAEHIQLNLNHVDEFGFQKSLWLIGYCQLWLRVNILIKNNFEWQDNAVTTLHKKTTSYIDTLNKDGRAGSVFFGVVAKYRNLQKMPKMWEWKWWGTRAYGIQIWEEESRWKQHARHKWCCHWRLRSVLLV